MFTPCPVQLRGLINMSMTGLFGYPILKGIILPLNIKEVHAYGIETEADLALRLAKNWKLGSTFYFCLDPFD